MNCAPADALEIFLQPGEFYFGEEKTRIRTLLGSCVAVTLWHPRLLMFQRELQDTRTRPGEYQVKLFGGGRMFAYAQKVKRHVDVSDRNVEIGRQLIAQHGFKIHAEDLGGDGHRNVVFDLWSGDVWLKKAARTPSGGG